MPVLDAKILDAGKEIISMALLGITPAVVWGFECGDEAGFDPVATDTSARGNIVYTGDASNVQINRIEVDTVRYVCTITEAHGPFLVGNVVLFMSDTQGNVLPFMEVVFPVQVLKKSSQQQMTTEGYVIPGTRLAISIELKHTEEVTIESITVETPEYASLATFGTNLDVPNGAALTYRNFIVQYDTRTRGPVMFTVDQNNVRWGMPFTHQLSDPNFGHMDGGTDGEGYGMESASGEFVSGQYYMTPNNIYDVVPMGGSLYGGEYQDVLGADTYLHSGPSAQMS